jgi:predicted RNase H-like nuclease (RuvC/YqgF family)
VSNQGADERPDLAAHSRLRVAVERLLDQVRLQRDRTERAEARVRDLEGLLARFARGEEDPARLAARLELLRDENDELRRRLGEGVEGVERLLARIRFLEEHGR